MDFSELNSFFVEEPCESVGRWVVADQVIGKGFALHCLNVTGKHRVKPEMFDRKQKWVVHLMDHCSP